MRTLVTGGAGFIGSYVVDQLVAQGSEVYVFDNLDPQVHPSGEWPDYVNDGAQYMEGDIRDPADVRDALLESRAEVVIHLAAKVGVGQSMYDLTEYTSVNAYGTANLLEEIERLPKRHTQRLIVASSMSIYGEGAIACPVRNKICGPAALGGSCPCGCPDPYPVGTTEGCLVRPASIYAIGKRDQEEMCLVFGAAYGIPTTALRFFNTYGPRQKLGNPYTGVVAIFASRLLNGKPPIIFGDGQQSRDFVHVRDVARAVYMAADSLSWPATSGLALNIGTGVATTVEEVARKLEYELCLNVGVGWEFERKGDVRHCFADPLLTADTLGWRSTISLNQGLKELLPWLQAQPSVEDGVDGATELLRQHGLTS